MRISEALNYFLLARGRGVSDSTKRWYTAAVRRLIDVIGDVRLEEVEAPMLWRWRDNLCNQQVRWQGCTHRPSAAGGLSAYTIDRQIQAVRSFFKWLVKHGQLSASPAADIEHKRPADHPPKRISEEHVQALLEAARREPRDLALLRFALATGARRGGLQGLKVGDLDLTDCSAALTEKGNKTRRVYYDTGTRDALAKWLRQRPPGSDAVWVRHDGEPLSLAGLRQILRRLCERAGIPNVSLHQLRHTMAYTARKRGVDPDLLRQQLGHADIRTTYRTYIQWADEDRKAAFVEDLYAESKPRPSRERLKLVK